jgi:hypothetical protein
VIRKSSREEQRQIALTVVQRTENGHTRPELKIAGLRERGLVGAAATTRMSTLASETTSLIGKGTLCWLDSHRATSTDSQRVPWLYQASLVSSARDNGTTQ